MIRNAAKEISRRQALRQAGTGLGMLRLVGLLGDAGLLDTLKAESANPTGGVLAKNPLAPRPCISRPGPSISSTST